jgi:mono/diheme cytochrome c family protein
MGYGRLQKRFFLIFFVIDFMLCIVTFSQESASQNLPESGRALYRVSCAACHGADGRGASASMVGFDTPLPDFTDCNFSTREAEADWAIVVMEGGPARGFSEIMPAFGDALTEEQIRKILKYIRTLSVCDEWPRGELNLPRALYTTKAYPEDELVLSSYIEQEGLDKITNKLIYERRIGARNQVEVVMPFGWYEMDDGNEHIEWTNSLGDVTLAAKRVLFHSSASIVSAGAEMLLPTGDEDQGFGNGTTVFEPYLAYGQLLPDDYFLQFQGGLELPCEDDLVQEEAFLRMAAGRTFAVGRYGSNWSPMVEILGSKNLDQDIDAHWDIVPQIQIALNRRQHVRLAFGVRIPLNHTNERDPVYAVYLLWDTFDGGFFEGW